MNVGVRWYLVPVVDLFREDNYASPLQSVMCKWLNGRLVFEIYVQLYACIGLYYRGIRVRSQRLHNLIFISLADIRALTS